MSRLSDTSLWGLKIVCCQSRADNQLIAEQADKVYQHVKEVMHVNMHAFWVNIYSSDNDSTYRLYTIIFTQLITQVTIKALVHNRATHQTLRLLSFPNLIILSSRTYLIISHAIHNLAKFNNLGIEGSYSILMTFEPRLLLRKVIINEYVVFIQHIQKSNIKAGLNWDCVLVWQLIRLIWLCLVLLKYAETACYSTWLYSYQYLFTTSVIFYLVSWHLCTWVHFLAGREIRINNYITAVSKRNKVKLWHLLLLFTQMYRVLIKKRNFCTITWRISCYHFKTILICWRFEHWCFWTLDHTYPASYLWVFIDGKFVQLSHGVRRRI